MRLVAKPSDIFPNEENWQLADCNRPINCTHQGPKAELSMVDLKHLSFLYKVQNSCTNKNS